jgi:2,4-dienoyl-CoA reductase-like NADH-dependent reductase (Old Yellow Enzyme family)
MQTGLATAEGAVTESLIEHYVQRSKGLGLLVVEHSYVTPDGQLSERQVGIYDDALILGLEKLTSSVHAQGTPIVIQLNHAGGRTTQERIGIPPVAPSSTDRARELRVDEIHALAEAFVRAADRAMKAGFDGVEIHGAHGFLLNQFFSPLTNRRQDEYGGSLANRMQFPLEVIEKVKETVGGRLLLYRVGSVDMDPAGTQIEDSVQLAVALEGAGVDIIDVSGGLCGSRPDSLQGIQGFFIPQAQRIKTAITIPVIGVGGITDLTYADRVVRDGEVDLVAVGRVLLQDADWVRNAIRTLRVD